MILKAEVAENLKPLRAGGITLYPASALGRIFEWADREGRTVEWVEGVFHNPDPPLGQLSLGYICERRGADYAEFRETCLGLVDPIEAEGIELGMGAYFEIGISAQGRALSAIDK
jgi:hypothetical protein